MTAPSHRQPSKLTGRALLAVLAATAALAGGAQALTPAPAAALDGTGPRCTTNIDLIFVEACVEDENGGGGASGRIGDPGPDPNGGSGEQSGGGKVVTGGVGDPGPPDPGDDSTDSQTQSQAATPPAKQGLLSQLWSDYKGWKQRRECRKTYVSIKKRIRYRYGGADFDRVTNTTDKPLAEFQQQFDAMNCADALHLGI
jgi:hypothetical protein